MNIVLYVNSCLPVVGGREVVVHQLACALKELGHRVRVVGPAGFWSQRQRRFDYPLHRWPALMRGVPRDREQIGKLFFDCTLWGCDVIHAHNTNPCGYQAARLKSLRNFPLVVTPHGEDIHVVPEIAYGQRLNPLRRAKIEHALASAELITSISDSVEASLLDAGAEREKIRKVPNGIDIERFERPVEVDIRQWLQVETKARLILTVGNYRPCKGYESMIRAMPLILSQDPRVCLIVVGRATDLLQPLIDELGLRGRVILTGPMDFPLRNGSRQSQLSAENLDRLAALYQNSEIYVSAGMGEGAEGLSLAVLDAMAAGLPVVATDISGNRDLVREGEVGFLVPPADSPSLAKAVLRLLSAEQLRRQMRRECRRIAVRYRWANIARQYLDVYQEARERSKVKNFR